MKTICFVRFKATPFGGAERYLQRLNEVLKSRGIPTQTLHARSPRLLPSWLRVLLFDRQICRQKEPECLYFSLDRIRCPDLYRAGDGVHRAYLQSRGPSLNPLHAVYLWLEKRTFLNARHIIANSYMVREQILRYYPVAPEKITVIYNGVPLPAPPDKSKAKAALASEFGFDPSRALILFVGSGFARKGVAEYLQILSRTSGNVQGIVVGKEKRLDRYRTLARQLGLSNRVLFTGPRRDVERFYSAADIFLFPTHYEPFSNVVLEALGHQTVVFTTRQNGASEILESRYVMEGPNDLSVVEKIETLLNNPPLLGEARVRARKLAEKFPIERNVEETLALLDKIQETIAKKGLKGYS